MRKIANYETKKKPCCEDEIKKQPCEKCGKKREFKIATKN